VKIKKLQKEKERQKKVRKLLNEIGVTKYVVED
jgi:uncharacterized protein with GYD domain